MTSEGESLPDVGDMRRAVWKAHTDVLEALAREWSTGIGHEGREVSKIEELLTRWEQLGGVDGAVSLTSDDGAATGLLSEVVTYLIRTEIDPEMIDDEEERVLGLGIEEALNESPAYIQYINVALIMAYATGYVAGRETETSDG